MRFYEIIREGEDDAGWFRGISRQEADNIRKGGLPKPSAVPIPMDNEVMDHLGIDDEEAWELQKELEGQDVINVTSDQQNAEGYGDEVLWFERHLVDLDFKPYGVISLSMLEGNPGSWGLVTPWDEQVNEDEFNKCYDYAEQLYTRAKQKGLDVELVQVAGYQGDDSKADERWKEIPKKYWKHYVVKMGTTVLDPSASQFDPNAGTKYPERTLNKMWDEQYVIKEMSYRDATKLLKKHHYHLDRQQGRHEVWKDEEGHSFALPHKHHGKDLSKGIMHALKKEVTHENFADGKVKGKSRPGRVKKAGASCKGSVTDLRAKAKKASGEKAKMYHWCANMKAGKKG